MLSCLVLCWPLSDITSLFFLQLSVVKAGVLTVIRAKKAQGTTSKNCSYTVVLVQMNVPVDRGLFKKNRVDRASVGDRGEGFRGLQQVLRVQSSCMRKYTFVVIVSSKIHLLLNTNKHRAMSLLHYSLKQPRWPWIGRIWLQSPNSWWCKT